MTDQLVLIPGFANNELVWQHQIDVLSDLCDIHVYIMDKEPTREEMVNTLLAEAPDNFILAGHSMGGWIAQAIAAKAPERIAKLILLNTWATPDPRMQALQTQVCETLKLGQLEQAMQQHIPLLFHRFEDPNILQDLQQMIAHFSLATLIQQLEAMLSDYSSLHHHPSITSPALIIHSKQDALFPEEHHSLLKGIKNAKISLIEDCGHASIVEQPKIVTELMRSFIEEN